MYILLHVVLNLYSFFLLHVPHLFDLDKMYYFILTYNGNKNPRGFLSCAFTSQSNLAVFFDLGYKQGSLIEYFLFSFSVTPGVIGQSLV